MQCGTGSSTAVQVDYGLLIHKCAVAIISSECSAQMCSERAGDYYSSSKEQRLLNNRGETGTS